MNISDQWFRRILDFLYQRRSATRGEVIQATSLNPACVSLTIRHLVKCGVIQRVGELRSTGGRNRDVLKLNSEVGYFVVVDLEGTRIRVGLTNLLGDIRCRWEEDVNFRQRLDIHDIAAGIESVLNSLDSHERSRVLAVGVSYTGLVDESGHVTAANLGWTRFPLVQLLGERVDLPIFYGIDGRCKVLAERWLGVAQESDNCIYVLAGLGVGVGSFLNGRLLTGQEGFAGEFGHITVDLNATDRCACGKTGCLEAIASSPNIVRQYLEKIGRSNEDQGRFPVTEVFARARAEDPAAIEVMERVACCLGLGLSHLVNTLNPGLIVLGGDYIAGQDLLLEPVKEQLRRHCLPMLVENLEVKASSLGQDGGLKGAASLAFSHVLHDGRLLRRITSPTLSHAHRIEGQHKAETVQAGGGGGRPAKATRKSR